MIRDSRTLTRLSSLAAVIVTVGAGAAWAEKPDLIPREVYEAPRPPAASVPERATESMEPKGVRAGSFLILPSAEFTTSYDSNVFATSNNEEGDVIFSLVPAVRVRSDFNSPLRLNFDVIGVADRYVDNTSENVEGYLLSHDGSWEIAGLGEQSFLKWGLANARDWEERGSPDDVTNSAEPTIIHSTLGYLGFQYKPGALSISPRVSARYVDLDDGRTAAGTSINNDDRDRWVYREGLRIGYEFVRGYEGYIRGTLNQRRYENKPDDAGFNRDSDGWEAVAGAKIGLTEITNFDVYAGYISQSYDDARLPTVEGVGFGGQLNWSPRREWQLAASVARTVEETILTDYAGYLATTYALSAGYQLMPSVRFDARFAYSTFDFERLPSSSAGDREEEMLTGQVGVRYYLNPMYYVRASYTQTAYSSNAANSDYDKSVVFLTLGAQY